MYGAGAKKWAPGCENISGKLRQKWQATAGTKFTKPRVHFSAHPCMGKWPNRRCIQNQIMMEADHVNVGRSSRTKGRCSCSWWGKIRIHKQAWHQCFNIALICLKTRVLPSITEEPKACHFSKPKIHIPKRVQERWGHQLPFHRMDGSEQVNAKTRREGLVSAGIRADTAQALSGCNNNTRRPLRAFNKLKRCWHFSSDSGHADSIARRKKSTQRGLSILGGSHFSQEDGQKRVSMHRGYQSVKCRSTKDPFASWE